MTKNKVIHARIDDNTHKKLFEKCNELGCSFTDYIQSTIKESLEQLNHIEKKTKIESEIKTISEPIPKPTIEIIWLKTTCGEFMINVLSVRDNLEDQMK